MAYAQAVVFPQEKQAGASKGLHKLDGQAIEVRFDFAATAIFCGEIKIIPHTSSSAVLS